jgi:hypothetical protein
MPALIEVGDRFEPRCSHEVEVIHIFTEAGRIEFFGAAYEGAQGDVLVRNENGIRYTMPGAMLIRGYRKSRESRIYSDPLRTACAWEPER